jgi:hypothetical protein
MMETKCTKCDREFTDEPNDYPGKVYVHQGEVICEDCLMGMGVLPDHAKSSHTRLLTEQALFLRRM